MSMRFIGNTFGIDSNLKEDIVKIYECSVCLARYKGFKKIEVCLECEKKKYHEEEGALRII